MKLEKLITICIAVSLALASVSSAGMLTLSTMSSDETDPDVLDATLQLLEIRSIDLLDTDAQLPQFLL